MKLQAVHDLVKKTITVQDATGTPLATYHGATDTVEPAPGVTVDTLIRAFYAQYLKEMQ